MARYAVIFLVCSIVLTFAGLAARAQAQENTQSQLSSSLQETGTPPDQQNPRCLFPLCINIVPEEERDKLPLPFGLGLNYYTFAGTFNLSNVAIDINGQPVPSQALVLDSADVVGISWTLRGDVWVLPFLDVYALTGSLYGSTRAINGSMMGQPLPIPQRISFHGTLSGYGATFAYAHKNLFMTYDWNTVWPKLGISEGSIPTIVHGPRVGVLAGNSDCRMKIYVGAVRQCITGDVEGSIFFDTVGFVDYHLTPTPEAAWNYTVGTDIEWKKHLDFGLEYGFGQRHHTALTCRVRF